MSAHGAEARPDPRAAQDRLVAQIAAQLLGVDDEALDQRIVETLQQLLEFLDVDRAHLVQNEGERAGVYTHHAVRPGIEAWRPAGTRLDFSGFPWMNGQFVQNGLLHIDDIDLMPPGTDHEREALEKMGVRSILVLALGGPGPSPGALGLHSVRAERAWSEVDIRLVEVVGNLLSAAVARRRASQALKASEARQRAILDGLPDVVFVLTAEAVISDVHTPPDLVLPVPQAHLVGAELTRLLPSSVASSITARVRETLATKAPQTAQYMLPVGETRRYFEVRLAPRGDHDVVALVRDVTERRVAEQQLREQERLYEILVQSTQDAIVLSDRDGWILSWNSGATRMFGHRSQDILGRPLSTLVPEYQTDGTDDVVSFMASGKSGMLNRVVEVWAVKRDGTRFPVEMTLSAYTSHGETLLASVIRDITERRDAEHALRHSEQRYRQLVQNSADGILLHDEGGRLVDVNDRTVEMLGFTREELLCSSMQSIERDTLPEVHRQFWRNMRVDQAVTLEGTYQRKDGSQFPVEMRLAKFQGGTAGDLILVIARDVTERKASEAVMLEHREQLRHLASQLTLTEEQQRRELAVQLHDGIGQELAMCRLRIQTYRSEPEATRNPAHLDHALKFVEQAIARVHSLTFDLSPPALHELGLPAALRSLGRRIKEDHGLDFEYEEFGEPCHLPKELEVLLFRSVRELAINVVKHAQARTLRVSMRTSHSQVEIAVADDGVGIDPEQLQRRTSPTAGGFGLFSVKERLSSVQGELVLHGAAGTVATIVVPLDEQTPYAYMLGGKK